MARKRKVYVLSSRYGTELNEPELLPTKRKAQQAQNAIMYEVLIEAYRNEGGTGRMSLKKLNEWAEKKGYGGYGYFWNGYDDATEVRIDAFTI